MFSPYHAFGNCRRLADAIENNTTTDEVRQGYNRYHFAVIHKLKCVNYYLARLKNILAAPAPEDIVPPAREFLFSINRIIDGYFQSAGSALDILAREILTYFGETPPNNTYFQAARSVLNRNRSGDPLLLRLADPPWRNDLSTYRNALTHELIIAASYNVNVNIDGPNENVRVVIPLPDNPRMGALQRTFNRHPDVEQYTKQLFGRILRLINPIYGEIAQRANTQRAFPL